jgi:hypothetical protein
VLKWQYHKGVSLDIIIKASKLPPEKVISRKEALARKWQLGNPRSAEQFCTRDAHPRRGGRFVSNYLEIDVVKNTRTIERLKAEMLKAHWLFHHGTATASEEDILEGLAKTVGLSYLIARRLGFDFSSIDRVLYKQVDEWQYSDELGIEQEWGDCGLLKDYLAPEE